jgi:nucleotide-binding universal stress UspA family protein
MLATADRVDLMWINASRCTYWIIRRMFKRILVPVDASPASSAGLRLALKLARDQKARLRLIHLASQVPLGPTKGAGMTVQELFAAMRKDGRRFLERKTSLCRAAGVRTDDALYIGLGKHPAAVVAAEARKWRADLIVMGTHGRRGISRMMLGSDAQEVVRTSPVPVLLTRK